MALFWVAGGLFVVTAAVGLVAIKALDCLTSRSGSRAQRERVLSMISCLSAGLFLGALCTEMLLHLGESYAHFRCVTHWNFPLHYFSVGLGFIAMLFFDRLCAKFGFGHSHDGSSTPADVEMAMVPAANGQAVQQVAAPARRSSLLNALTILLALGIHSLLEGVAVGLQESSEGVFTLALILALHKAIESVSLAMQMGATMSRTVAGGVILLYATMTPSGALLGAELQGSDLNSGFKLGTIVTMEGLSCGSLFYLITLEILVPEMRKRKDSLWKVSAVLFGFLLISVVAYFFGHSHSTGDHHNDDDHCH